MTCSLDYPEALMDASIASKFSGYGDGRVAGGGLKTIIYVIPIRNGYVASCRVFLQAVYRYDILFDIIVYMLRYQPKCQNIIVYKDKRAVNRK